MYKLINKHNQYIISRVNIDGPLECNEFVGSPILIGSDDILRQSYDTDLYNKYYVDAPIIGWWHFGNSKNYIEVWPVHSYRQILVYSVTKTLLKVGGCVWRNSLYKIKIVEE